MDTELPVGFSNIPKLVVIVAQLGNESIELYNLNG